MIRDTESFGILLDTMSRFVRDRLIPREQEVVDTDAIPEDILAEMRRMGEALDYAIDRRQFGQPIGEFQLVQAMLADSQTELYAARSMTLDAARKRDAGEAITMEAACCKLYASEMVGRVADRAVQIHGGAGYMQESAVERFYRDVRLFRLYEGTSQIQQLLITRNMLKKATANRP